MTRPAATPGRLAGLATARGALQMGRATPTRPTRLVYETDQGAISVPISADLWAAHTHLMQVIRSTPVGLDGAWFCQPERSRR